MASRRNFLKFQFLGNRERITELSGPLRVGQWALPHCLEKPQFGDQIRGTGPFESKFQIFDLVATSCTLAYIFFMHSDRGYPVARRVKGWEDPLQNDHQNWGFENFWGRGTFWVCPLLGVLPPFYQCILWA